MADFESCVLPEAIPAEASIDSNDLLARHSALLNAQEAKFNKLPDLEQSRNDEASLRRRIQLLNEVACAVKHHMVEVSGHPVKDNPLIAPGLSGMQRGFERAVKELGDTLIALENLKLQQGSKQPLDAAAEAKLRREVATGLPLGWEIQDSTDFGEGMTEVFALLHAGCAEEEKPPFSYTIPQTAPNGMSIEDYNGAALDAENPLRASLYMEYPLLYKEEKIADVIVPKFPKLFDRTTHPRLKEREILMAGHTTPDLAKTSPFIVALIPSGGPQAGQVIVFNDEKGSHSGFEMGKGTGNLPSALEKAFDAIAHKRPIDIGFVSGQ